MIAEAWKDNEWVENNGKQPVDDEARVDVKWSDYTIDEDDIAESWTWCTANVPCITHWRLHTPLDTILPAPTRPAPAMPACKPSRPDKIGKLSDEDILAAFNKLTGSELSEDAYNTLLSLQEMFDGRG